ncbi:hypothetical protein [Bermanella sp. R86510]|uniref:hypothetical protein n=1 Tax=unclassified Bermanella TaxID=2627862 RepID=UPI0037C7E068
MNFTLRICFLFIFSSSVYSEPVINGVWKENCERNWSSIYVSESRPIIMLEASHVYIYVNYKSHDEEGINIYFDKIADLGPGGRGIAWSSINKEKPIGRFKYINKKKATLEWYGFTAISGEKIEVYSDFMRHNELRLCKR